MLPSLRRLDPSCGGSMWIQLVLASFLLVAETRADPEIAPLKKYSKMEPRFFPKDTTKIKPEEVGGSVILTALRTDSLTNPNVDVKIGPFDQKAFDAGLIRTMNGGGGQSVSEQNEKKRAPADGALHRVRCGSDKKCRRIRRLRRQRSRKWRENEKSRARWSFDAFVALQRNEERLGLATDKPEKPKNLRVYKNKPKNVKPSDDLLKSNKQALVITKASHVKRDWCRTDPLKQKIREPGCRTKTIINNFCYGQCNSFYIPLTGSDDVSKNAFQSCAFCKPHKTAWIDVTLRCPGLVPPTRTKKVLRVQKCRCQGEITR